MPHEATGRTLRRPRARRQWTWAAVDAAIWVVAVYASVWLRFDFRVDLLVTWGVFGYALLASTIHVLVGYAVGPYRVRHRRGSIEEITDLARTFAVTVVPLLIVPWLTYPHLVPRTTAISAGTLALLAMLAARLLARARHNRLARSRPGARPALVYGAGNAGDRLVRSLLSEEDSPITPVGLLDDDPAKSRLRLHGVKVVGTGVDLADAARQLDAGVLVLAMPSAAPEVIREVSDSAHQEGLDVLVLPSMSEMVAERPGADSPTFNDLRDLDLADVLGRPPVNLDTDAISDTITGKTVLVTGAGGSIGSELCRQIARFEPRRLILLDRDESGLQATDMSIRGNGLLDGGNIVLADIRDATRLRSVMAEESPDVVFHAAALKHLPLLEAHPFEAWKSNVLGTLNVLAAADAAGVRAFVNVSTDKAADPTSVLGQSKRLGELLTAWYAAPGDRHYVSVRFGNVLGSRGSVVHAFTTQIRHGGPLTVTHPDVERYFMLISEACQLVLQARISGASGEVMVLEMGQPVRILDLAQTLIVLSGRRDVEIHFTGLRPGEKLSEELFSEHEARHPTGHELIDAVTSPAMDPAHLCSMQARTDAELRAWLAEAMLEYGTALPLRPSRTSEPHFGADGSTQDGADRAGKHPQVAHEGGSAHVGDVTRRLARQ